MNFKQFGRLILIEQTLFTLPFAYLGILFAGRALLLTWVLATIALAAARTAGMSFNRVIDAKIDAKNPRTKDRLVPQGVVSGKTVWIVAIISSLILVASSYFLNDLCFYLSFAAIVLLFTYSFFKRFSASSHFYFRIRGSDGTDRRILCSNRQGRILPFILGITIMAWISGLDIVYALQDVDFDKSEKLHSVPISLGRDKALVLSACCYIISIVSLAYAGFMTGRGFYVLDSVYLHSWHFFLSAIPCQEQQHRRRY